MLNWGPIFEYNEDMLNANVPDAPGVYRLVYKTGDEYFVFYHGQTDNLYKALLNHLNLLKTELPPPVNPNYAPKHCIKKCLQNYPCYFRFIEVRSKRQRRRIQAEDEFAFIPKDDMEFDIWLYNFITQLEALGPDKYGITPAQMAGLKAHQRKWSEDYDAYLRAQINLKHATKKLNDTTQKLKDAQMEGEEWKGGDL